MSSLKMFCIDPQPKGLKLPEGFKVTKFTSESQIAEWIDICKHGLIAEEGAEARFRQELMELDGPDPYRDTYFIEDPQGRKIATFTVVPNMWKTGMGYIHMVACHPDYRGLGLGKFMADYSLQLFVEMGKKHVFLLTGDSRLPALKTYINAGFLPVNYVDDEGCDMVERWQSIVNTLKIPEIKLLDPKGQIQTVLRCEE